MVKVSAPMMSLAASGTLADAITFSTWKGRPYVRERVIPSNPQSGGQVGIRAMFKFLSQNWAGLSGADQADWQTRADQLVASPFNAFMSYNMFRWRNFLGCSQLDPATVVGVAPGIANIAANDGIRQITVTHDNNGAGDPWAMAIFRALAAPPAISFATCVAVILSDAADTFTYVDTPLDPGVYHYRLHTITDDGLRADVAFAFNGTAT